MSDSSTAALFGKTMRFLAEIDDETAVATAQFLWKQMGDFDFSPDYMHADKALETLGLAKRVSYAKIIELGLDDEYAVEKDYYLYAPSWGDAEIWKKLNSK